MLMMPWGFNCPGIIKIHKIMGHVKKDFRPVKLFDVLFFKEPNTQKHSFYSRLNWFGALFFSAFLSLRWSFSFFFFLRWRNDREVSLPRAQWVRPQHARSFRNHHKRTSLVLPSTQCRLCACNRADIAPTPSVVAVLLSTAAAETALKLSSFWQCEDEGSQQAARNSLKHQILNQEREKLRKASFVSDFCKY